MVQGTGSNVGKSVIVCALCRIFHEDGIRVAPFKSQNMSLNSYVTLDGKEMGRAQVAQAYASGLPPAVEMNPILLKPTGENGAQVIAMGIPVRHMKASEYYENKGSMLDVAVKAYAALEKRFDVIVIEGAGSPAEINLKENDIVNMKMAEVANAPVILVVDIERGGAFAWIVGTLELLDSAERERVCGVIINKFRGDFEILKPGIEMLEERIKKPVLGVIPYFNDIEIEDEDSVCLESKGNKTEDYCEMPESECITIAVVRLPRISNFTDFDILRRETGVRVCFVDTVHSFGTPDLIIIPGTKNTIGDLAFIKESGIADRILDLAEKGSLIMGICGGYQMLGKEILDPQKSESSSSHIKGLGLLDVVTTFFPQKITYQVKARLYNNSIGNRDNVDCDPPETVKSGADPRDGTPYEVTGYEIHMGKTQLLEEALPFSKIIERSGRVVQTGNSDKGEDMGLEDGAVSRDGKVVGTYLHGIFDNDLFRLEVINSLRQKRGLSLLSQNELTVADREKERHYKRLADVTRRHLDMDVIYSLIGTHSPSVRMNRKDGRARPNG
ncbi:MAG: cobyric acid synthase [Candidatus Scalindua sp. AMX11]|nr:MAG: cobyric acid synthase [Candidatus Scalindua sp.]NOG86079.1 cobyric acid synthase [Planctomycetota bacterium]RZV98997.1 MAG: cobyric acid synthase [Candidatus Scalindua sp. SCAELEC01]TDE66963.1 MAG: cobyric acid synthase [Candidatus Scalindua sp. AMX11]